MSSDPRPDDPRAEFAALVRAAGARVELEQYFGIESWSFPELVRKPAAVERPPWLRPKPEGQSAGRPADAPEGRAERKKPRHIRTPQSMDMFKAKGYAIEIPDGLSKAGQLDHFAKAIADCQKCGLCEGRTQVVFGAGDPDADLMFIGEAPGRDEDIQGIPFVGRAGQLLTKIIQAIDFTRDTVYIANINKCRPPNNRAPTPDEMDACMPYLLKQIDIIQPKVVCLLGATAVRGLLKLKTGITKLRGEFIEWRGIQVMPTYHPAYLLRNPAGKRDVWEDVQRVRDAVRGS